MMTSTPYLIKLLDDDGGSVAHVVTARDIPDALATFGEDFFHGWSGVTVRELDDAAFRAFLESTRPKGRRKKAAG
jgi:hypothetical protein